MHYNERQNFVESVEKFVKEEEEWLENIINSLGWNMEELSALAQKKREKLVCCPVLMDHRIPVTSLDFHLVDCEKKHNSYPTPPKSTDYNDDIRQNLGYVSELMRCKEEETVPKNDIKQPDTSKTLSELLKAERDSKRRRAAHRGKRVHCNKKSYNEILREVIHNEMLTIKDEAIIRPEKERVINGNPKSKVQNITYSGVGNLYHHGNPYKRWLTIEEEEKKRCLKCREDKITHVKCTDEKRILLYKEDRKDSLHRDDKAYKRKKNKFSNDSIRISRSYRRSYTPEKRNRQNPENSTEYSRSDENREAYKGDLSIKWIENNEMVSEITVGSSGGPETEYEDRTVRHRYIFDRHVKLDISDGKIIDKKRRRELSKSSDDSGRRHKKEKKRKKDKKNHKKYKKARHMPESDSSI